jgi:hypothetical protein
MSWISDVRHELDRHEVSSMRLRWFGLACGGICAAMAIWIIYKGHGQIPATVVGIMAVFLAAAGGGAPHRLQWIYRVWIGFAFALGWVISRVVLTIVFLLIVMPLGWMARLWGEDFLDIRPSSGRQSWWIRRPQEKIDYEKMY